MKEKKLEQVEIWVYYYIYNVYFIHGVLPGEGVTGAVSYLQTFVFLNASVEEIEKHVYKAIEYREKGLI